MVNYQQNTRRIAKNTAFLYIRMLVMMLVSLFTFRELLKELGVADYGTYNVVGGVVILFSFLSNAMTQSNQRFLSFHIGKGDAIVLKKVFSMIINVQIVMSVVIVLFAETIGLWFINTKMNFDGESMRSVNVLYQLSIFTFVIQILQIPYTSALISHEKMHFFSYFSIAEALIRLGVVLSLGWFSSNRLVIYGALLLISAAIIFVVYVTYCINNFSSCRYSFDWDKRLFFELTNFSGWNMLGGIGNVGAGQGINMLFNIFCGVTVNAAMGISHQVSSAVSSLVANVQVAFNPQIVKSYAVADTPYFISLIFRSARMSFCLIAIIGIPIILYMRTILGVWLTIIPNYAIEFVQLSIIFCTVDALSGPLWTANQAAGKVKNYMIIISLIILSNLPVAYVILKFALSPAYVMLSRVLINIVVLTFRLEYLKRTILFPSFEFIKNVLGRAICLILVALPIAYLIKFMINGSLPWQIIGFLLTILLFCGVGFRVMLTPIERSFVLEKTIYRFVKR